MSLPASTRSQCSLDCSGGSMSTATSTASMSSSASSSSKIATGDIVLVAVPVLGLVAPAVEAHSAIMKRNDPPWVNGGPLRF